MRRALGGIAVVVALAWSTPAPAQALEFEKKPKLSIGGGIGYIDALHVAASAWLSRSITADGKAFGALRGRDVGVGAEAGGTLHLGRGRTRLLVQAAVGAAFCPECQPKRTLLFRGAAGFSHMTSRFDLRLVGGVMYLKNDDEFIPAVSLTFYRRFDY